MVWVENYIVYGDVKAGESEDKCAKCEGLYQKGDEWCVALCVCSGTMKNVFTRNCCLCHAVLK